MNRYILLEFIFISLFSFLSAILLQQILLPDINKTILDNLDLLKISISSIISFLIPSIYFKYRYPELITFSKNKFRSYFNGNNIIIFISLLFSCLTISILSNSISEIIAGFIEKRFDLVLNDNTQDLLYKYKGYGIIDNIYFIFIVAFIPAISEELYFRATLLNLQKKLLPNNEEKNLLINAIVFSIFHLSIIGFLTRFLIGYIFAKVYHNSQDIRLSFLLHALYNAIAAILLLN